MREALYEPVFDDVAGNDELDVQGVGRAIARRKWQVIVPTAVALIATAVYVTFATPRYTGEAKVLIENEENYFTRPDNAATQVELAPDPAAVTSQIQLVTSRDLARDAIKVLKLKGLPEFDPDARGPGPLARLLTLLGLHHGPTNFSVEDRILQSYYDRLSVTEVAKSRVLDIDFSSADPHLAAKAANTIADLYIRRQASAKRQRARLAAESLAIEIAGLKTKVADAENKAATFRASANLLVGNNNTTIATQQLAELASQLSIARTTEAGAQAKAALIRKMLRRGRLDEVPDVANNKLIRQISAQRIKLRAQIALESRTYLPEHPVMKELNAQLADLDHALKRAAQQTARSLENEAQIAGTRVANLRAALDQQKKKVGDLGADEVKMQELDSKAKLLKKQLDTAITKHQEALALQNAASTPGDARLISRAVAPLSPTFPKKLPLIIFATIAGLVLSVAWVVASELLSGRAFAPVATEADGKAPDLLSEIAPASAAEGPPDDRVTSAMPLEPAAFARSPTSTPAGGEEDGVKAAENILGRLAEDNRGDHAVRVLVAGSSSGTSGMATALPFARALARDRRVILVELEAERVAANSLPGFSELIAGRASFADVIHRDRGSRLHRITAGQRSLDPCEDLDLALEALSQTYDFVVLASPPVDAAATARALAPRTDFVVLGRAGDADDATARDALVRSGAGEIFQVGAEGETVTALEDNKTAA